MKIFFDTEFTGLHKETTLISIGLISEDNKTFYAEFIDYAEEQCDDWIKENVVANLILGGYGGTNGDLNNMTVKGGKAEIKFHLFNWLEQFDSAQLVSDVCHYDMMLFIDIFGTAFDLPKNVCPYCHDINQDIAEYLKVSDACAFDTNREHFLLYCSRNKELPSGYKHNSLYDAKIIRAIWSEIGLERK